jgi:excisionase family DNA binding protein
MVHDAAMSHDVFESELLTLKQAAQVLGLSTWTLRSWIYQQRVSYHRMGKLVMVARAEVDRLLAESEHPRAVAK